MAETADLQAHAMSLPYPQPNSVRMLGGARFQFDSNQDYRMPADQWATKKNNPELIKPLLSWFINDHYTMQVPRLLTLERYYTGDNDIHYWRNHKPADRADNRIQSGLPRYITNIRVGYQFGNPLKFGYSNITDGKDTGDDLIQAIDLFNSKNDEPYHEKIMSKNLNNTGRAYELMYIRESTNEPAIKAIDPANCFVVYDTTIEMHSLFAVRYFMVKFMDQVTYYVDVYTDSNVYHFTSSNSPTGEYTLIGQEPHYFGSVPVTEYRLNDERIGSWEPKLDEVDAYDKSLSEMANSEEEFNNAILVISGDIDNGDDPENAQPLLNEQGEQMYDQDGNPLYKVNKIDPKQRVMFVKASVIHDPAGGTTVVPTDAKYLTKELNATDWKIYVDRLLADIHKDTNTPDVSDENFAANASGVAMTYKLWGSDQERATQESLYTRGLMRRLRLMATYWTFIRVITNADEVENVEITYTPNLPKNDSETVTNAKTLSDTGKISDQTIQGMVENVTGVPQEQETQRMKDQHKQDMQQTASLMQNQLTDQEQAHQPNGNNTGQQQGGVGNGNTDQDPEADQRPAQSGQSK